MSSAIRGPQAGPHQERSQHGPHLEQNTESEIIRIMSARNKWPLAALGYLTTFTNELNDMATTAKLSHEFRRVDN